MRVLTRILLVLTLSAGLAACGGGGGSNNNSTSALPAPAANQAPVARISASVTDGFAALSVDLDASGSSDSDGQVTQYSWDFGDGSPVETGVQANHTFVDPGGFNVRLTVTDDEGAVSSAVQNVRVRGTRLSGTVQILTASAVDSDVNDRLTQPSANNDALTAQAIPNPVRLGGWVNLPGTGESTGNSFTSGDPADFFAVSLSGNELILLNIGDATADIDLHLRDASGNIVDASLGTDSTESLEAPGAGDYFIEVFPAAAPTNISGGSNYVLSVGQDLSLSTRTPGRLSDPFVPGDVLLAAGQSSSARARRKLADYDLTARGQAGRFARATIGEHTLDRVRERLPLQGSDLLPAGLTPGLRQKYRTLLTWKHLNRDPEVAGAELNLVMQTNLTPDDGLYALQWHLPEIKLPEAWDLTIGTPSGGDDIIVAVVDTGILPDHPDLDSQLVDGYDFISDSDRARDLDGIDSDPTDRGDLSFGASSSFHGTHVSGTVAARTDNGEGVAGVSWDARIMPMRALGVNGGTTYDVMQAVLYAAGLTNDSGRLPNQPADIINLSLGSPFFSQAAQDIFSEVRNRGIFVVASAGNESTSTANFPAAYNGVISVSASTINGGFAPYSNFGIHVDVAAPGGYNGTDENGDGFGDGVVSTLGDDSNPGNVQLGYGALNGTSMAAPHVAGVIALMKAVHPDLTPAQFDGVLMNGDISDDLGTPGRDDLYGYGRINAQKAVLAALSLAGGAGSDPGPVLGSSLSSINLGVLASDQVVRMTNLGTGSIEILPGNITTSDGWLDVQTVSVDGNGLGDYRLVADRSGLAQGPHSASAVFTPTDPGTNPVSISVTVQIPGASVDADAGLFYVIAVNEDGSSEGGAAVVGASNGAYSWALNDLPAGNYRIVAGSDMDDDNFLCDAGESCGAYRTLDTLEQISVDPATAGEITGIDFVADFRAVITTQAIGTTGGLDARTTSGFPFLKAAPAPRLPDKSAAEQR